MARIECGTHEHYRHFDELLDLCRQYGEDPYDVGWVENDVIDLPLVRFGLYKRDGDGRAYLECRDTRGPHSHFVGNGETGPECGRPAMTSREHALVGDLPAWWPN